MYIFRKALLADENYILSIYKAVKEKGKVDGTSDWNEDYPNKEILKEDLKKEQAYVLISNEDVIAAITMIEEDEPGIQTMPWTKARACFLARLCVSPEYQGRGIGEKMMKYISECAKEKGFEATHHLAAKVNEAANRLYVRMGYRNLGPIHLYETDFNAYEMLL